MSADKTLWFRKKNGEVFKLQCHPDLEVVFKQHYLGKKFELLPGDPAIAEVKGETAPEPEPKQEPKPLKRGPKPKDD
jgi:hypothetical protein